MTITLQIAPRVQDELARQAAISGSGVEAHAALLLEGALHLSQEVGGAVPLGKRLVDAFARAKDLLADGELDISRDPSPGRTVEFS